MVYTIKNYFQELSKFIIMHECLFTQKFFLKQDEACFGRRACLTVGNLYNIKRRMGELLRVQEIGDLARRLIGWPSVSYTHLTLPTNREV